ncbi:MAG: hypothetical protein QXV97_06185 [Candidatus Caldarchaeum sp.]
MAVDLKRELLRLLNEDEEFRYAVAGRIGILEILKRLDKLEEGQNKLWENQEKLWEEVRSLREGQNKLWESNNRLWEEVRDLRYAFSRLEGRVDRLEKRVSKGFAELGSALGVTYEMHANAYIQVLLEELGYPDARVGRGYVLKDGEVLEIDMFCEEPLVVGEVTTRLKDEQEAGREISKLLEKAEAVSSKYRKKPSMTVLSVDVAPENVVEKLRTEAEKHGIKLILGREIEEAVSA